MNCNLYYFACFLLMSVTLSEAVIVKTLDGKIQGLKDSTFTGKRYFKFRGVPFAQSPIGNTARFLRTKPVIPWTNVWDATYERSPCLQDVAAFSTKIEDSVLIGKEDCLYLNIASPKIYPKTVGLPVMVWIHGGGFVSGSGSFVEYPPDLLIDKNVILVTVQYRLTMFGFISSPNHTEPFQGNTGIHDQLLALKWIKRNIKAFGGNPHRITLFGGSAGGSSVHLMSVIPKAKSLFSRVIAQSGSAFNNWVLRPNLFNDFIMDLECDGKSDQDLFDCVTEKDGIILITKYKRVRNKCLKKGIYEIGQCDMGVVIESNTENALLTQSPYDAIKNGNFLPVPTIFGFNADDGDLFNPYAKQFPIPDVFIPLDLMIDRTSEEIKLLQNSVVDLYFKKLENLKNGFENQVGYQEAYDRYLTDVSFLRRIKKIAELQGNHSNHVYIYRFSFNALHPKNISRDVVGHGEELPYLFSNQINLSKLSEEMQSQFFSLSRRIIRLWTNFAKTGNPNKSSKNGKKSFKITWKPIRDSKCYYLYIGRKFHLRKNPSRLQMDFWDRIYQKYKSAEYFEQ